MVPVQQKLTPTPPPAMALDCPTRALVDSSVNTRYTFNCLSAVAGTGGTKKEALTVEGSVPKGDVWGVNIGPGGGERQVRVKARCRNKGRGGVQSTGFCEQRRGGEEGASRRQARAPCQFPWVVAAFGAETYLSQAHGALGARKGIVQ